MKLPLEISFEGLARSEALEAAVAKQAAKLDRYYGELMRCQVRIVCDEKHKHQGKPFAVRIDLTLPGHEIVSNREAHEDAYVALRDAFDATSRQLEEVVSKMRGEVKTHAEPPYGKDAR
ncbi:HPF/RaiA family ribosome-associated protein [Trinickia sp. NRRL B-1857]|uniref:HPF/RaiA family ribosome-associated protein n=1 Tax=Trinickia sp. NRRL B-1857 TaxID=3162879 RepID=UPI003D2A4AC7